MKTILWAILTAVCTPVLAIRARLRPIPLRRTILIVQWAKLGDLVCTTGMFRAIKQVHPDWEVHVLCRARCAGALHGNPFVDRVHAVSGGRIGHLLGIRNIGFDTVINAMPDAFASTVGIWCCAPLRINAFSFRRGAFIQWLRVFSTVNREYRTGTRTFDHYMALLRPLGIPAIPYTLDFFPSEDDRSRAGAWMQREGLRPRSFVCLNISAGNAIKEWPMEKCSAFADRVIEDLGRNVVLSTLDEQRVADLKSRVRHPERVHDGSSLTLGQLGAVCTQTAAYVAVDTGPLFVAYASGAPVVALVGGSDPREQLPPAGPRVAHVPPPPGCTPWVLVSLTPRQGTEEQLRCIRETSVESVLQGVRAVIGNA